jgi:CIC family chloride channel protein
VNRPRSLPSPALALLAIPVGVVAGIGAVLFRALIGLFHNVLFLGVVSTSYDANLHTPPSPWGPFVILVPVIGAVGVAYLVQHFAPEAKGHGVPEVMDAIYYQKGIIRPIVAAVKALASALSIGSGGAVGREGPIIQIGAAFGSTVAQFLRLPVWQRITMIAAGAGGGIAATFNTPIGGVLFALEIVLHEISVRTLVPVAISTATAAYVGRIFFGDHPSFFIPALETPQFQVTQPEVLASYAGLGIIVGAVSALFIKSIYAFEDFFEQRVSRSYYARHAIGMLLVGVLIYVLMITTGHYYVEGVGYATIQDVLDATLVSGGLLLVLFLSKLLATSLTLGSGASGGIFSPSLYIGATLGAAYAVLWSKVLPGLTISPPAFAVAGMAGVVGSATGAAMAGIVMTYEMTLDYNVIIPTTIVVAIAYGVRKLLSEDSIYTLKLVRRGHAIPAAFQTNFHHLKPASAMMERNVGSLPASTTVEEFARLVSDEGSPPYFLIVDDDRVIGVAEKGMAVGVLQHQLKSARIGEIAINNFTSVAESSSFFEVLSKLRSANLPFTLVVVPFDHVRVRDVKGVIASRQLVESMVEDIELFSD